MRSIMVPIQGQIQEILKGGRNQEFLKGGGGGWLYERRKRKALRVSQYREKKEKVFCRYKVGGGGKVVVKLTQTWLVESVKWLDIW